MRTRTLLLALLPVTWATGVACSGERRAHVPSARDAGPGAPPGAAAGSASPVDGAPDPLAGVVDPWAWPRAAGASARERAIENLGPWEPVDPGNPRSEPVSANGHHWTRLVDLAWDRDVVIDLKREPVDLDADGAPDATVTRRIEASGGILANPALFGLVETPEDPRGRIGRVSASTGVLGLREAVGRDGRPTGLVGMTCWLCHAARNPADGSIAYGLPNPRFDYGLLLATSSLLDDERVLDLDADGAPDGPADVARRSPLAAGKNLDANHDGRVTAGEFRRALGFPPGRTTRARLLLAGPGRQDLTGEFGLDLGVPGLHSARHAGTARLRQGARGVANPVSVPSIFATAGLALQNWSGSESSREPWLERLAEFMGTDVPAVVGRFGLPAGDPALARRALLLDLRNLGTLGLQQDSFPGLLWSDMLRRRTPPRAHALAAIPRLYAAEDVRALLTESEARLARPRVDAATAARGRAIFSERVVGEIANRQVLKTVPENYRPLGLAPPVLAPMDPGQPMSARLPVRCADCHNATPLEGTADVANGATSVGMGWPLGRCSHCHMGHPDAGRAEAQAARRRPATDEARACAPCHARHAAIGPVAWSSSMLLPFDADGDGNAQDDESDDRRAGGIGTEAWLAFDVPRAERPDGRFSVELPLLPHARRPGPVERVASGVAWVRVAPLVALFATAPYLHNGSVPTLEALLGLARKRPSRFPLGDRSAGFILDARQAGSRNFGHDFGTNLGPGEKRDLVAFLMSL